VAAWVCEVCGGDEDRPCTCPPEKTMTDRYCYRCSKDLAICECSQDDKDADEYYDAKYAELDEPYDPNFD